MSFKLDTTASNHYGFVGQLTRIILGHRFAAITEVYAELDPQKAMEAILRVG